MKIVAKGTAAGLIALAAALGAHADPQPTPPGAVTTTTTTVRKLSLSDLKDVPLSDDQMKIEIGYIESHVQMPAGAKPLDQYVRYYAQDKDNGFIHGVYMLADTSQDAVGSHIVDYDKLPVVMDGGCDVIEVVFIRKIHALRAACHGYA